MINFQWGIYQIGINIFIYLLNFLTNFLAFNWKLSRWNRQEFKKGKELLNSTWTTCKRIEDVLSRLCQGRRGADWSRKSSSMRKKCVRPTSRFPFGWRPSWLDKNSTQIEERYLWTLPTTARDANKYMLVIWKNRLYKLTGFVLNLFNRENVLQGES